MANRFAVAAGNWSATSTWSTTAGGSGGASVPGPGDAAHLNNRAVTVDTDIHCDSITTRANNGATAGGSLTVTANRTIQAALWPGLTTIITISTAGITVNVVGDCEGSTTTNNIVSATLNAASILNVTGNLTGGGGGGGSNAIRCNHAEGVVNIIGDCIASNTASAAQNVLTTGVMYIVGNCYGAPTSGSVAGAVNTPTGGVLHITGNCYGGDSASASGSRSPGAVNANTGTLTVVGSAIGGATAAPGVWNASTGTVYLKRAVGNGGGPGAGSPFTAAIPGAWNANMNGSCFVEEIEFGPLGAYPVDGAWRITGALTNVCKVTLADNSAKTLSDPNNVAGLVPDEEDVRLGVVYAGTVNTGTLAVPPPEGVAAGVPTDDTVGTAVLTVPALANVVGQLLADALSAEP